MTPVEELFQLLWDTPQDKLTWFSIKKRMLEKEKKVIMEAHQDGAFNTEWDEATDVLENAQDYYNETFNTKEK